MKVEYNDYELVYLVREQNEAALDILIQKYSPLIGKIASSYYGVGFDYEDFFQEGRMAFIKSIYTFDETSIASFYSYSMTCVRNAITTAYRKAKRSAGLDLLTDYSDPVLPIASEAQVYYYLDRDHNTLNERLLLEFALREKGILSEFEKTCLKYYLLDNNYIKNKPFLENNIYFNINATVQDPRVDKYSEAAILKEMCDNITKYQNILTEKDKKYLLDLQPQYARAYNKLASAIITMPSVPYKPASAMSSSIIATALGGPVVGYLVGKEQEQKNKQYYKDIGTNSASLSKIDELRSDVYEYYGYTESVLDKYKQFRDEWEKTKEGIFYDCKNKKNTSKKKLMNNLIVGAVIWLIIVFLVIIFSMF